ncbi:MAG: FMN-dependent NADH-azoreductase [Alphaproteobacteria bacterium]|nr:FMN-dependent NADH-azoreductase [Alphaproteobacteria bacterium]
MTRLLHIDSSIAGTASKSRALSRAFVERWRAGHPGTEVIDRDLAADPVPHAAATLIAGLSTAPEARTPGQAAAVALSDTLIAELEAADVVVIGAPMYNFAIPSTLKAWIDHVALAGRTFRYTAEGPVGLLRGKRVFVVVSRGGIYSEGAGRAMDFQEPYLRAVLGFLGIDDVTFIRVEGQGIGPEVAARGLAAAEQAVGELAAA